MDPVRRALVLAACLAARAAGQAAPAGPDGGAETAARSLFAQPLFLAEEPPECRAAWAARLPYGPTVGASPAPRDRAAALELARRLREALAAGASADELGRRFGAALEPGELLGLGALPPGTLAPALDRFLFAAELGEVSPPVDVPDPAGGGEAGTIQVLQRIERWAGCRLLRVAERGEAGRRRAEALLAELRAGADFAALAGERSDDRESAARGGAYAIFERGPDDRLVKAAAFDAAPGEVVGPIETPLGFDLVQRVPPETLPAELRESRWIRARALLVSHAAAPGPVELSPRSPEEAQALVLRVLERLEAGEPLAALAAELDDDPTGRARRGDLGWLYRGSPGLSRALEPLFRCAPGERLGPIESPLGWLFLERER